MFLPKTCITTKYCIHFISNHFRLLELVESDLLYSMRLIVYPHPRNLSMHPYICSWTRCPIACRSPWQGGCSNAQVLGRGQHCNRMVLLLGTTTQKTTDLCGHLIHSSKMEKFPMPTILVYLRVHLAIVKGQWNFPPHQLPCRQRFGLTLHLLGAMKTEKVESYAILSACQLACLPVYRTQQTLTATHEKPEDIVKPAGF